MDDLTDDQMRLVTLAKRAQDQVETARLRLDADNAVLQRTVYDAMSAGVPARTLALILGLSIARIYQLRNLDRT